MQALSVKNVVKEYSGKSVFRAVNNLNFDVDAGETVAFLGPNGAGKSTTIKILCGILMPTSGESRIFENLSGSKAANQSLGLVFGTRSQLWMHMTVLQSLDMLAEIYSVSGKLKKQRLAELASVFEIESLLQKRARSLSLGERMRCELVGALIHKPRVLLADEPTIGLDIVAKTQLRALLRRWQQEDGTTVLLTSHDVSDVEALCQRCILIDHGEKKYDGALSALKGELGFVRRISVTLASADSATLPQANGPKLLRSEGLVHEFEVDTRSCAISTAMNSIFSHYQNAIVDVGVDDVPLEEVLAGLFKRRHADEHQIL